MQYEQTSESTKPHTEESKISESSRAYKKSYESGETSAEFTYTGLETSPDHPHHMRQGGHISNTYKHLNTIHETHNTEEEIPELREAYRIDYESDAVSNTQTYTE